MSGTVVSGKRKRGGGWIMPNWWVIRLMRKYLPLIPWEHSAVGLCHTSSGHGCLAVHDLGVAQIGGWNRRHTMAVKNKKIKKIWITIPLFTPHPEKIAFLADGCRFLHRDHSADAASVFVGFKLWDFQGGGEHFFSDSENIQNIERAKKLKECLSGAG